MTVPTETEPKLRVGEFVLGHYVLLHKGGRDYPDGPVETVDRGGAGTVYRVKYQGVQDRALKLLTASSRRQDPKKQTSAYEATFEREQQILLRLSHGNIVRLYEFGDLKIDNRTWPYHVTEFVDGPTLIEEMRSAETTPHHCYTLLTQVMRAVRYMHELNIGHGDLKYENIRCRHLSDRTRQAVLLDFGSAQLFGEKAERSLTGRHGLAGATPFATTEKLLDSVTRPHWNKPVTATNRDILFPYHDIRAAGVLLNDLLDEPTVHAKFEEELGTNGMRGMELMRERLLRRPNDRHYSSINRVCEDWDKLRANYVSPAGVAELGVAAEFKYAISIHGGRTVVTPRLNHLVSHKLFQRIGEIPQLELLRLKFTGGTHTRAQHSALVLRNARYYLSHLLNGPVFRLLTKRCELEATLILALLHDIGHYQLSHMFEDYASEQKRLRANQEVWDGLRGPAVKWREVPFDIPSDDDLFVSVFDYLSPEGLEGEYGEVVRKAVEQSAQRLGTDVQKTLGALTRRHFGPETYRAVIDIHESIYRRKGAPSSSHIVLGGVLSSALDADKTSYLRQDSEETGVRFGSGIDLDGLLGALRSPSPVDIDKATGPLLGITSRGIAAAESVLTARKLMYERVYWHPTNRAMMAMVKYCITRLFRVDALDMREFLGETFFMSHSEALKWLHHRFADKFGSQQPGRNPISGLLEGERDIYRPFVEFTNRSRPHDKPIWEYLLKCTVFDVAALEDTLVAELPNDYKVGPGDIILDVPAKDRGKPSGERGGSVYVYDGNSYSAGKPLDRVTPMADMLVKSHESRSKIYRVLLSRPLAESLTGRKRTQLGTLVRQILRARVSQ